VKVPAVANVRLNVPPDAIVPEFHVPPSAVDVCGIESLLIHVTVPFTPMTTGFGLYAVAVSVDAPITIDTLVPPGVVVVVLGDVGDDDELPQPDDKPMSRAMNASENRIPTAFTKVGPVRGWPIVP
jgi:hypothetical protein